MAGCCTQGLVKGAELCLNPYFLAGRRSELAGCRSTLSMSKIKVRISETKYRSFYETIHSVSQSVRNSSIFRNHHSKTWCNMCRISTEFSLKVPIWNNFNQLRIFRNQLQNMVKFILSPYWIYIEVPKWKFLINQEYWGI